MSGCFQETRPAATHRKCHLGFFGSGRSNWKRRLPLHL